MKVVAAYLPEVTDLELKRRMVQFMDQETAHQKAHHAHNARAGVLDAEQEQYANTRIAERRPKMKLWLAAMVSIEHIAANMGRHFLINNMGMKGREFALFAWHSREELEHKSLAIDLWDYLGYSRVELRRTAWSNLKYVLTTCFQFMKSHVVNALKTSPIRTVFSTVSWGVMVARVIVVPHLQLRNITFHPDDINDSKLLLES